MGPLQVPPDTIYRLPIYYSTDYCPNKFLSNISKKEISKLGTFLPNSVIPLHGQITRGHCSMRLLHGRYYLAMSTQGNIFTCTSELWYKQTARYYDLSYELRLYLGKDLKRDKRYMKVVKCKDTG